MLRHYSVKARLITTFGGLLAIALAIGGLAHSRIYALRHATHFAIQDVARQVTAPGQPAQRVPVTSKARPSISQPRPLA